MSKAEGAQAKELRVLVEGDLPKDVMQKIGQSVRRAVLDTIAELDIAPPLVEKPLKAPGSRRNIPGDPFEKVAIGGPIGFFAIQPLR